MEMGDVAADFANKNIPRLGLTQLSGVIRTSNARGKIIQGAFNFTNL